MTLYFGKIDKICENDPEPQNDEIGENDEIG